MYKDLHYVEYFCFFGVSTVRVPTLLLTTPADAFGVQSLPERSRAGVTAICPMWSPIIRDRWFPVSGSIFQWWRSSYCTYHFSVEAHYISLWTCTHFSIFLMVYFSWHGFNFFTYGLIFVSLFTYGLLLFVLFSCVTIFISTAFALAQFMHNGYVLVDEPIFISGIYFF